jgi:DNA repair exonuclease SbcCD ATPase subunit
MCQTNTEFEKIRPENFVDTSHAKYIQKNGVLELAFKSRLETAKPFQKMVMGYLDHLNDMAMTSIKTEVLSYKSQLALTEKSHAELIAQYEKRIAEKDQEIKEKDEEIDEKDEELEQKDEELERKDELLEEKDVEIDEMDQALEAKKIDACDERDREIRELKQRVDELTDENYRLKEILEAVPEKYRGDYEVDDYEFIPSKRAREEKRERDSRIDDRREIDSYFKSKIVELKTLYDAVDRWKVRYAGTTLRKNKSAYKANYETAHQKLVEYLEKLKREEFFTKCKRNLDAYPIKFWQAYNGKLTD